MSARMIQILRNHWESLRDGGDLPLRSEINPRELSDVLDNMFILEELNADDIRVRIAGLTLCEMTGVEVRGRSPMIFFEENMHRRFASIISEVLKRPAVARIGLVAEDTLGTISKSEMVLLPLQSDFGKVNRAIGCIVEPDGAFTAPLRFQISSADMEPIAAKVARVAIDHAGFEERRTEFVFDKTASLRSIDGNGNAYSERRKDKPSYLKVVD